MKKKTIIPVKTTPKIQQELDRVGMVLRTVREDADISLSDFAEELKMTPGGLCNIENGHGTTLKRLLVMCHELGLELQLRNKRKVSKCKSRNMQAQKSLEFMGMLMEVLEDGKTEIRFRPWEDTQLTIGTLKELFFGVGGLLKAAEEEKELKSSLLARLRKKHGEKPEHVLLAVHEKELEIQKLLGNV